MYRHFLLLAVLSAGCWAATEAQAAHRIRLDPPEAGSHIIDKAALIDDATRAEIEAVCARMLAEQDIPVVVVTTPSMGLDVLRYPTIEAYSRALYEQWGDDARFPFRDSWRRGILLLVSKGDRKARIELGMEWQGQYNDPCEQIMAELIVPRFRDGAFSLGLLQGVTGLEAMSRDEPLPEDAGGLPEELWLFLSVAGFVAFIVLGLHVQDWLEKKRDPEGYAKRMEVRRIEMALDSGPGKRRRRRKHGDYERDYDHSSGYSSGSDFGGGGGATGSW